MLAPLLLQAVLGARSAAAAPARVEGFNFPCWYQDCYAGAGASQSLAELAGTGAKWAAFTPTWYTRSAEDSSVAPAGVTVSDEALRAGLRRARSLGLTPVLKTHVDLTTGGFRGAISPKDEARWWQDYRGMILHYARLAAEEKVGLFVVGTELAIMSEPRHRDQWVRLIADVRAAYPGPLTYAANFYDFSLITFWPQLDYVGIDGYFPAPGGRNVTMLRAALSAYLPLVWSVSLGTGKPVLFTEVGLSSQKGASLRPWAYGSFGRIDHEEQRAYMQAFLDTFAVKSFCAGFLYWAWDIDPNSGGPGDGGMTVHHKPAQELLERWFRRDEAPQQPLPLATAEQSARLEANVAALSW
jgi:hypothetical protein